MFKIYRKCEKTENNIFGVEKLKDFSNIDKPFLMCIAPRENDNNSVFGIIKEGARAARVRTSDELAGGFKIDEMGVNFLGIKFEKENEENKVLDIVDDFIYPNLVKNKDLYSIKKNARRMNFFTYCNATKMYVEIEKKLVQKLASDGFNMLEIKDILSQISLTSIASQIDISKIYATCVCFKDVNDTDVFDYYSRIAIKKMDEMNRNTFISKVKSDSNSLMYFFNGKSSHELKSYFDEDNIVKSSLCATVSRFVENSIINENNDDLITISSKYILPAVIKNNSEFVSMDELLDNLDKTLNYGNVNRYTLEEHEALCQREMELKGILNNNENQIMHR